MSSMLLIASILKYQFALAFWPCQLHGLDEPFERSRGWHVLLSSRGTSRMSFIECQSKLKYTETGVVLAS